MPLFSRLDAKVLRRALSDPRSLCAKLGYLEKAKPQQGGGLLILCPSHLEKTPSCSVTQGPDGTIRVCCFGCGFTGDALHLIAVARGIDIKRDFRALLFEASYLAGRGAPLDTKSIPPRLLPEKPAPALAPETVDAILRAFMELCPLTGEISVCNYLLSRPAGKALFQEARRAGWGALPEGRKAANIGRKLLTAFGKDALRVAGFSLSTAGPFPSYPKHRLLIPYTTPNQLLQAVQRRRLNNQHPRYVFPKGQAASWPYGMELLSQMTFTTSVMYVEGAIDVLDRRANYRAANEDRLVLGLPGLGTWNAEWANYASGRTARVALDTDDVGEKMVAKLCDDLRNAGAIEILRTRPKDKRKDWNSLPKGDESGRNRSLP